MALCFRDRSFCAASDSCLNKTCDRNFNDDQRAAARKWWSDCDGEAPVSFQPMTDCSDYPVEEAA